eukprot:3411281-Amphidinium_carterae.3
MLELEIGPVDQGPDALARRCDVAMSVPFIYVCKSAIGVLWPVIAPVEFTISMCPWHHEKTSAELQLFVRNSNAA